MQTELALNSLYYVCVFIAQILKHNVTVCLQELEGLFCYKTEWACTFCLSHNCLRVRLLNCRKCQKYVFYCAICEQVPGCLLTCHYCISVLLLKFVV